MLSGALVGVLVAEKEIEVWLAPGVESQTRQFYAGADVRRILESKWRMGTSFEDDSDAEKSRHDLLAVIIEWQKGNPLVARQQLKPLEPPPAGAEMLWELRAPETPPGARVIGFIPYSNAFIATGVYPRKWLGARGSRGWMTALGYGVGKGISWFGGNKPIQWPVKQKFGSPDMVGICDDFA